jgi:hypothetical protein
MRSLGVVLLALAVAGCAPVAGSAPPPSESTAGSDDAAARAYCTEQGGQLVDRVATWNTNADPPAWLQLAGRMTFCEFESTQPGDSAATRIAVDLVTLYSEEPTLAAIAYLSKVGPVVPDTPSENPGAYNCNTGLGGAGTFGNTATAGGWVDTEQPVFKVMDMCFFADGSAIDEFGIFYYATGAVRGADLAPILRYQPDGKLPAMYEAPRR